MTPQRADVLRRIADHLGAMRPGHPLRVGVDGVCGVGKSTFARDLAAAMGQTDRPVVHLDSDAFHHVRERRRRQGHLSGRGYYEDAYDFDALADRVLRPLGPGGTRTYAVRVLDFASDAVIADETAHASGDAVVIFDATFLQRDELRDLWDAVVYLHADEDAALARALARDMTALGGEESARAAYESRYAAACRIYLDEQDPRRRASIVVEHTDPDRPQVERLT
ncbi:uridine kinase [Beutenbergia cavernae DSM 12333]|uniref:Uridine kinase n=1 Tax=Beutenbergia cavernae (strain ATCC BAA-8 / DSM 12333 / CCUG 43141 / JCM 11478 / NBRC 16432 / NCIMB 13614 / HKI 0122) TaxID=471853 RepID=C5BV51_BEUC1|nr:AAA family ATPase [Beutenbergia cavernae]ACQ80438.1 uridine kinase [Beutenbergia cavernae DSM 12333]